MTVNSHKSRFAPVEAGARRLGRLGIGPWRILTFAAVLFLASWNLTGWPPTWFDEGSHLMVPKTLVRLGVYADYDSSGFRYFGPTLGVGPTVLLPIAGMFEVAGVGLLQARAVMALYLVLAVVAFHSLARRLTCDGAALLAAILLVIAPAVGTLEFGRQVLGEVPALCFLCLGLNVLLSAGGTWRLPRLLAAGMLLGLAAVTKYQLLGVVLLGLGIAWVMSRWRGGEPLRVFVVPAVAVLGIFAAWQVCLFGYLGPSSFADNVRFFRQAAGGAAFAFSSERMSAAVRQLLEPGILLGAMVPAIAYGTARALRSDDRAHAWRMVVGFALAALSWFVVASIGWRRYAYPGVALACIAAAALLVEGLGLQARTERSERPALLPWVAAAWIAAMVLMPLPVVLPRILAPPPQDARSMADAVSREVAPDATIAAWEPEMTFLTDHRYRVPPQNLLPVAVAHVWAAGPPPSSQYDFMAGGAPDYVLEGPFARGIGLYPQDRLHQEYERVDSHGPYVLFRRKPGK